MVLECLAATAVFALTCAAVLWFMRVHDPPSPRAHDRSPGQPREIP
jgi:hypothetical protein